MKKKKIFLGGLAIFLLIGLISAGIIYYYLFAPQFHPQKTVFIYIDHNDTADSICKKVKIQGNPQNFTGFLWIVKHKNIPKIYIQDVTLFIQERMYIMYSTVYTEDIKRL